MDISLWISLQSTSSLLGRSIWHGPPVEIIRINCFAVQSTWYFMYEFNYLGDCITSCPCSEYNVTVRLRFLVFEIIYGVCNQICWHWHCDVKFIQHPIRFVCSTFRITQREADKLLEISQQISKIAIKTHIGSDAMFGILLIAVKFLWWPKLISNLAFISGSSKHGNASRA